MKRRIVAVVALGVALAASVAWVAFAATNSHALNWIDGVLYYPTYARAQHAVEHELFDAESAKFKDLYTASPRGSLYVCGLVNAKNRMGAYVGYVRFYAAVGKGVTPYAFTFGDSDMSLIGMWDESCRTGTPDAMKFARRLVGAE